MRMRRLSKWWREGECCARIVYRQSFNGFLATITASLVMLWLLPSFRTWYILVMCFYLTGGAFIDRRRAIILTDSSLIYRPVVGRPVSLEFAQIISVEKCTVP